MGLYYRHRHSFLHETGPHPENAGRIEATEARLSGEDFLGYTVVEAPAADDHQIERVHPRAHREAIRDRAAAGGGAIDADTVMGPHSYDAALRAAGAGADAALRVLAGPDRFAFCGLRPPGHHCETERAMGFCLFNNAAICARAAQVDGGADRVMVIDWDVHHGNGTQEIFYGDDSVLYLSIHQSPLYPGTGSADQVGEGAGAGYTVNLPVPQGSDGERFLSLIEQIAVPIAALHGPDLLIVSAGFDAHRSDPLAQCSLEAADFGAMAACLRRALPELPTVALLEGGYDPEALAESVAATLRGFAGELEFSPAAAEFADAPRSRLSRWWDLG